MSSGGQVVGGVVGAVAGFFLSGFNPMGALYGAQLGMMAGGYLDPPKGPNTTGPRLDDLTLQTSTYGAVIPRAYGTIALNGNVFWLENNAIKETVTKKKSGGKGGGSKTTTRNYSYSATFAVGLCKGPISGVRRIWIGPDLFYDAGSDDPETIAASNDASEGFAIYLGTDTQLPDARMQATLGAANTPAWRGLAYIVFYDLQLARYANSLAGAQVRVEIMTLGEIYDYVATQRDMPTSRQWACVAYGNGLFVALANNGSFCCVSADGISWDEYATPAVSGWQDICFGNGVFIAVADTSNVYSSPDGITWSSHAAGSGWHTGVEWNGSMFLCVTDSMDFRTSADGLTWTSQTAPAGGSAFYGPWWNGSLWITVQGGAPNKIWTSPSGVAGSWTFRQNLTGSNWFCGAVLGGVVCLGSSGGSGLQTSSDGITWTPNTGIASNIYGMATDGLVFLASANSGSFYTSTDGVTWTTRAMPASRIWYAAAWSGAVFVVTSNSSHPVTIPRLFVSSIFPTLDTIVSSECLQSGLLTGGDIDVSALTQEVRGYRVGTVGAIRAALDPLQGAWPFDVVQHGYVIQFIARGGASVATIPAEDLDARADGQAAGVQITTSREMDSQLPRRVTVQHLDYDREYNTGTQYAERLNTAAINAMVLDLPIVLTATEAAGKAEVLLYLYWLERYDVAISLPPTYLHLEPGDVVTLVTPEGNVSLRLVAISYTSDGRVECTAKYNSAAIYTPTAVAASPAVTGPTTITPVGASVYHLLDLPLLSSAQSGPSFLSAMTGALAGWQGGVLMQSIDAGATWASLHEFGAPGADMGTCSNSIGAVESRMLDSASALSVTMTQGELFSVTQLAMLAGGNHFAYGADGRWEIIAAQTCTLVSGATYTLTNLLRGRFGTEWAMGLHAVGDALILLDTTDVAAITMSAGAMGLGYLYRGITVDRDISTDGSRTFAYQGVNFKPLSPVFLSGSKNPATGDWSLSWIRRTRDGGQWVDWSDALLSETTEAYQIDICTSGTYATVRRTIYALTATCDYTLAQQVADFGAAQSTIYATVYQISDRVARGYPLSGTIASDAGITGRVFSAADNIAYLELLPAALQTLDETFPADVGFTKYTESSAGTTAVAASKYTVTHVGSKNDIVVKNTISFSAPLVWVEAAITITNTGATSYDNGGVGIVKDANNFLFASMDRLANTVRLQIKIGGSNTFIGTIAQTWGTSFKLGLSLVANSACVWIDTGSGWTYKLGADVSGYYDFRTTGNLTGWNPGFTLANGGGNSTWDFSAFKAGSFGGVGMRDQTLVTDEYAAPYFPAADTIMFTATAADPLGTAYCGVYTYNMTTHVIAQQAVIMVSRGGKTYNDLSAHIIRYSGGNRRMLISTWGNGFGGSIQTLHELFTTGDILVGVNVVTMTAITLPGQTGASPGAYDAMMAWDAANSQWIIAYTLTDDTSFAGNPFYPAVATSAAMATFSLVAKDTSHRGYEGAKLCNLSGTYYITAAGPAGLGNTARVYTSALAEIGEINVVLSGGADTQPHAMIFDYAGALRMISFDNTRFGPSAFTWGHLRTYTAI